MKPLCFKGYYTQRFGAVKEFSNEKVEVRIDEYLERFCNHWLEEEFTLQSGASRYERNKTRIDNKNGHYWRRLVTARGVVKLRVPRGEKKRYKYTLFDRNVRKTKGFEDIVVDGLLKGHSSRKASKFFANIFGAGTLSHQAAVSTLKRFDLELVKWKETKVKDNAVVLVLDAVYLKGSIAMYRHAKPVLFAYAVYRDGTEKILDFEIAQGESLSAWHRFCCKLYDRGLKDVELVVHDDNASIGQAISLVWPKALDQQCVFHVIKNVSKRLIGCRDRKRIVKDVSKLYESDSEHEIYIKASNLKKKWQIYKNHQAIKYLFKMLPDSIKYLELPKKYWNIAKTSNRLERLFEELKRRIRVFRRFPNPKSCNRWLYALLKEMDKTDLDYMLYESQHNS